MTPTPKSLNSFGFQNVRKDDWDNNQINPLNEKANFNFPKLIISKNESMAEVQRAGKILSDLETKNFRKLNFELIQDIVIRNPLIAKNIGTPLYENT